MPEELHVVTADLTRATLVLCVWLGGMLLLTGGGLAWALRTVLTERRSLGEHEQTEVPPIALKVSWSPETETPGEALQTEISQSASRIQGEPER